MKSDFCYILDNGWVAAAKLDAMVEAWSPGVIPGYAPLPVLGPGEALAALLEPLAQYRTQCEQKHVDALNDLWDKADAGDPGAKKWASFRSRPKTRTVEPIKPQSCEVMTFYLHSPYNALSTCKHCGCEMVRLIGKHNHKFCSNTCAEASAAEHAAARGKYDYYTPKTPVTVACTVCGNDYTPKRSDSRYCSVRCRVKAHRAKPTRQPTQLVNLVHGNLPGNQ